MIERRERELTKDYLARCLTHQMAPGWMVDRARRGYYDDFESPIATPQIHLYKDASASGLTQICAMVRNGDFDATLEEGDRWIERQTGEVSEIIDKLGLRRNA